MVYTKNCIIIVRKNNELGCEQIEAFEKNSNTVILFHIIISAIFIFIVYKLKENSAEIIINYRLTLFLILLLLTLINIGLYMFFNKKHNKKIRINRKIHGKIDKNNR